MRPLLIIILSVLFCGSLAYAQSNEPIVEDSTESIADEVTRPGYFGWGLGVQVPMVGVVT